MAVFEPRDPHKSQDAVASIWNPSTLMETGGRHRKFSPKLLGQLTYSPKGKTLPQNNLTGKDPPQLSKGCPVIITCALQHGQQMLRKTHVNTHSQKVSKKIKFRLMDSLTDSLKHMSVAEYGLNMYNILSSIPSIQPPNKRLNEGAESGSTLLQPQLLEAELQRQHGVSCTHQDGVSTTVGNIMQTKHQVSHPGC